jgi:hypothetical protein
LVYRGYSFDEITFDSVYEKKTVPHSKMSFQTFHLCAQASGFNLKNSPAALKNLQFSK